MPIKCKFVIFKQDSQKILESRILHKGTLIYLVNPVEKERFVIDEEMGPYTQEVEDCWVRIAILKHDLREIFCE